MFIYNEDDIITIPETWNTTDGQNIRVHLNLTDIWSDAIEVFHQQFIGLKPKIYQPSTFPNMWNMLSVYDMLDHNPPMMNFLDYEKTVEKYNNAVSQEAQKLIHYLRLADDCIFEKLFMKEQKDLFTDLDVTILHLPENQYPGEYSVVPTLKTDTYFNEVTNALIKENEIEAANNLTKFFVHHEKVFGRKLPELIYFFPDWKSSKVLTKL